MKLYSQILNFESCLIEKGLDAAIASLGSFVKLAF